MLSKFFNFFPPSYLNNDLEYAELFSRMLALAIDLLCLIICIRFVDIIFYFLLAMKPIAFDVYEKYRFQLEMNPEELKMIQIYKFKLFLKNILHLLTVCFLSIYTFHKFKHTPGSWFLKIKILDQQTMQSPSTWQFTKRFFWSILSLLPLGMGLFMLRFSKKRQAMHDKIANTVVVRARNPNGYLHFFSKQNNYANNLNRKIVSYLPKKIQDFFYKFLIK